MGGSKNPGYSKTVLYVKDKLTGTIQPVTGSSNVNDYDGGDVPVNYSALFGYDYVTTSQWTGLTVISPATLASFDATKVGLFSIGLPIAYDYANTQYGKLNAISPGDVFASFNENQIGLYVINTPAVYNWDEDAYLTTDGAYGNSDSLGLEARNGLLTSNRNLLFDPDSNDWVRKRSNHGLTLLSSTARTITTNSADFSNHNFKGAHFIIDVTGYSAGSITPTIQGKDPVSGKYYDILVGNAIVAAGTTVLKIYPGIAASANASATDILPRVFRVSMAVSSADSITYSVGCNLIN